MTSISKPFETIKQELDEANIAYEAAKEKADLAIREKTSAQNRLNDKQKAFDEVVAAVRKNAPHGSDWSFEYAQKGRAV